ncbi:MAG: outer membrane protein transport protein [gamma proteobacterium symbiont of Lucinoma myriamae]|nr:outer membrane protein transport protein [gamma proteobacterium symbiont of Lucinoma myriamae]MCU7817982.1 outer membrane protein transport protein [gamma proteobacterium symbiont of Lucinoma myriamae]MCU7832569.1 outer membrane protein transport protein [gamma proteobacterium symbiont of Lucinoma myriamae]
MNKSFQIAVVSSALASSLCLTSNTFASGFAILENSASGMGQAFAGAAAVAEDPSTIYFNPAGMMYLEGTQVTAGLHILKSDAEFKDKGSTPVGGGDGGNAGDIFYIPNFYYVRDFGDKYKIGLGINAPFGLATEYKGGWMGRYASTDSEVKSININPAISFRANEKLAIGLGMNIQYLEATLEKDIYQAALLAPDGHAKMNGDSWGLGFNAGFIYEATPQTRLGVHYRSEISHTLEGDVKYNSVDPFLQIVAGKTNKDVDARIDLPSTFSMSLTHQTSDKLTLLADVTFTKWSNFEELRIESGDAFDPVDLVEQKWNDVFRYSVGMKYAYNKQWTFRTGLALDETPIDDKRRTSRIPGDDRTWLSFGASYMANKNLTIDAGYSHLWVEDAKINEEYALLSGAGELNGEFDSDVDILSVQGTWKF